MAKPKKPATAKPITDVAHEGQSAPSSSSRPLIVTNRPILRDPMISKDNQSQSNEKVKEVVSKVSRERKLQPPGTSVPAQTKQAQDKQKPKTEAKKVAPPDEPPETEPSSDTPTGSVKAKVPEAAATANKEAEHGSEVQKLIDSKRYFLPINTIEKRRSKRFVALGILLSLLLIIAWGDIALDAGLIRLQGIKPLTHFFST